MKFLRCERIRIARRRTRPELLALAFTMLMASTLVPAQSLLFGMDPGEARATIREQNIVLENKLLAARWSLRQGKITGGNLTLLPAKDVSAGTIPLSADIFILKFKDGTIFRASQMGIRQAPYIESLRAEPAALRAAQHYDGKQIVARFQDPAGNVSVEWRAILRDGANYLRQEISIRAVSRDAAIGEIDLFDFKAAHARVEGSVKGSPVIAGDAFFGFEHPLSACAVTNDQTTCSIARELPVKAGQTVTYSSVIGVSPPHQMRRAFLHYIERERPRPYRPFLTYNSWYDIGYNNPYDETAALDVINSFGHELVEKRGAKLDSFLFDDGWDNPHTLWSFGAGFPNGFTPLRTAAEKIRSRARRLALTLGRIRSSQRRALEIRAGTGT